MRIVSLLTALIVAASLYLLVFERGRVQDFAGMDAAAAPEAAEAQAQATEDRRSVSVVAIVSEAREIDNMITLRGRTESRRQVDVMAETSGRIVSSPLSKGSFVEAGDLLCELDPGTREVALAEARARLSEARAQRPEAEARVVEAEARLKEARIEQNAASRLSEGGFASQTRVVSSDAAVESALAGIASAKSGVESVGAGVQAAEAAVAGAEAELERLRIHAPFAGLLESDTAELGALMQPGTHCATVIQLDPIKLVGFVPETAVDRVEVGAPAGARLASGQEVAGTVTFLSRAADPETRTFRTEIEVPNPDQRIRDGQTAEIAISGQGIAGHLLPQSALTLDDAGDLGVRLALPDDTARFAPVRLLRDAPEGVYVAGLDDRVRVIVVGQEYVNDGTPVDVTLREAAP
ncbi:multidrug efflux system membrane fusion protein [Palleronia aestuarii]|uniref:Multidrug efflux system membrane fusion protein n=1 Tax=Palleronia aestuarii TaxID=568105 RepID=A0A2W7NLR9_9RHOB|nr:efflux RND transporter periplasmic adaptor subunit [Palleronia aestuarii]PZX17604.1 multidrug efflux system membrane fusion protein [Palleronia aestuarii]